MIKAILFDFDGVLTICKTGSETITNYISKVCDIPLDFVETCYYKYNGQLLNGELTHQDMWNDLCNDLGKNIDYQILIQSFENTALDKRMIDLMKELKEKYLIAMVTDNKWDRIDAILNFNNLQTYFDVVAVSAKLHSGKDKINIFHYVTSSLNVNPIECVFIDNTISNLIIPKQMGMKTILFDDENRNFEVFQEKLESFL